MEEEIKTPKPKGGRREGAGRKAKNEFKTERVSVAIPIDHLRIIAANFDNRSDFVQRAIKEKLYREGLI